MTPEFPVASEEEEVEVEVEVEVETEVEVDGVMCDSVGRGRDISCRGPTGNYLSGGGRL